MRAMVTETVNARARLRRIIELIESKEYFAVGGSQRYLATQRQLARRASRPAMLAVAGAAPVHALVLTLLHPEHTGFLVVLNVIVGGAALTGWWSLGHRLRRRPEFVTFAMTFVVVVGVMAMAIDGPRLVALTIADLMFLPPLVAIAIPWRPWTEIRWLAAYAAAGALFLAFVPSSLLTPSDRSDVIVAMTGSLIGSFVGFVLLFRNHVSTFSQMQSMAILRRREKNQRVELERVYRSLEITARTDELTRVGNRMKLQEDLVAARGRIGRTGRPIGILEIDLDHFKAINDHLGHLAGDAVLREVAQAIRDCVRADDLVFRYGGEEFLVLLGNIAGGVEAAGERLRLAVEDLGLAHPGNPPFEHVTISVGCAAFGPADLAQTAREWFARVDAAMYEAKGAGRNRVAVAGDPRVGVGAAG